MSYIKTLDAEVDFRDLGSSCVITSVQHSVYEWSSKSGKHSRKYHCKDIYQYRFNYTNSSVTYTSKEEDKKRVGGRCSMTSVVAGSFTVGQVVQCWQPIVADLSWAYSCGDEHCYKIFSPAAELNGAYTQGVVMYYIGIVALPLGALSWCGCCSMSYVFCVQRTRIVSQAKDNKV